MLERQDLPTSEQSAAVVYELIVYSLEHIYVYLCELQLLQFCKPFICFIKIYALANRQLTALHSLADVNKALEYARCFRAYLLSFALVDYFCDVPGRRICADYITTETNCQ